MTTAAAGSPAVARIPGWTFADRLRKIRRDVLGIEQEEMAQRLGMKKPAYAAWESGRNEPRSIVAVAKQIELMSRVPAAWVLGVESPTPEPGDAQSSQPQDATAAATVRYLPISEHGAASVTPLFPQVSAYAEVADTVSVGRATELSGAA
jgi:DNA-binding XRE family transcriptional regulator